MIYLERTELLDYIYIYNSIVIFVEDVFFLCFVSILGVFTELPLDCWDCQYVVPATRKDSGTISQSAGTVNIT